MSRQNYDATFCGQQPLHLINTIQPHGVLLIVSKADMVVRQASVNADSLLAVPLESILNAPLQTFVSDSAITEIEKKGSAGYLKTPTPLEVRLRTVPVSYIASVHDKDEYFLIEIEYRNEIRESGKTFTIAYAQLQAVMSAISLGTSVAEVAAIAAKEIKALKGFDKVMVYSFDEEWNGTVIAEEMEEGMDAYLGLKFPASDVPKTARELYFRNPHRIIPNREYQAVSLTPEINPVTGALTDLTDCRLRSVIPVHLEYLQNMNVMASMSTRIIHNEQLWGLIACHHRTAKYLSFEECSLFELLSNVISAKISSIVNQAASDKRIQLNDLYHRLARKIYLFDNLIKGLNSEKESLLSMLRADGVAICWNDRIATAGATPSEKQIESLRNWLNSKDIPKVSHLHALSNAFSEAEEYADVASGLLVLSIQPYAGNYILGFRSEVIKKVTWGGDPDNVITFEPNSTVYHPRNSFGIWKETVRRTCVPWTAEELSVAERFRNVVVEHTLETLANNLEEKVRERTEALTQSKRQLEETFDELAQITYVASHDLQEPARKISLFGNLLKDLPVGQQASDHIDRILQSSMRISRLLADLINFSKLSYPEPLLPTDLNDIARQVISDFDLVIEEEKIDVVVGPLPTVHAVPDQMRQVFYILISNSVKFARPGVTLEIRIHSDTISYDAHAGSKGPFHRIVVEDNGIGFSQEYAGNIFKVFQRLHARNEYAGTGIGLAIARKILEKHAGTIYAVGKVGEGATFTMILPVKG